MYGFGGFLQTPIKEHKHDLVTVIFGHLLLDLVLSVQVTKRSSSPILNPRPNTCV